MRINLLLLFALAFVFIGCNMNEPKPQSYIFQSVLEYTYGDTAYLPVRAGYKCTETLTIEGATEFSLPVKPLDSLTVFFIVDSSLTDHGYRDSSGIIVPALYYQLAEACQ